MNSLIRNVASTLARSIGLELIPSWRIEGYSFESCLRHLFDLYSIDVVIDVGANLGQYRDFVRHQVGYQGWIVSFEPDPKCAMKLQERSKSDGKWRIEPVALGRKPGQLDLHVMADPHFNSFLLPDEHGLMARQYEVKSKVTHEAMVEVRTLDDYEALFTQLGANSPYLKLDTQGFDLEVLAGSSRFLINTRALQTEASVRAIYKGMPDYLETLDFLSKSGFSLSNMFPVSADPAMRLVEFDCVAINSKFADLIV